MPSPDLFQSEIFASLARKGHRRNITLNAKSIESARSKILAEFRGSPDEYVFAEICKRNFNAEGHCIGVVALERIYNNAETRKGNDNEVA